jgi:plasmid stabilization system protein ParE
MNKVVWSKQAVSELFEIVEYWNTRNKSNAFSHKIALNIEFSIRLIRTNSKIGVKSNIEGVRMRLLLKNYYLIYRVTDTQIEILQFWDTHKNPLKSKYLK